MGARVERRASAMTDVHESTRMSKVMVAGLFALGLVTRFVMLNYPRQVVFDEYHFGKFVSGYVTGQYFFDIHPPLGKLLIAAAAWCSGYDGRQPFAKIGEDILPEVDLFWLRAVPATFGSALVPLSYGITLCVKTMELDGVALGAARDEDERTGGKEKVHALLKERRKEVEAALAALPPPP